MDWEKLIPRARFAARCICAKRRAWRVHLSDTEQCAIWALWQCSERYREESSATLWGYAGMRVRGAVWDYLRENGLVFRSRLLHGLSNISLGAMDFDYTDEPAVVMPRTQAAIDGLPPRWRDSLIRTARGETLMEVARDWGVADSRVAAVRRQAVERVRKAII